MSFWGNLRGHTFCQINLSKFTKNAIRNSRNVFLSIGAFKLSNRFLCTRYSNSGFSSACSSVTVTRIASSNASFLLLNFRSSAFWLSVIFSIRQIVRIFLVHSSYCLHSAFNSSYLASEIPNLCKRSFL